MCPVTGTLKANDVGGLLCHMSVLSSLQSIHSNQLTYVSDTNCSNSVDRRLIVLRLHSTEVELISVTEKGKDIH